MKIRIVSPGWQTYTGPLGTGTMFKNGLSVDEVSERAMMRIGSILNVVEVDEEGNDLGQVGASSVMVAQRGKDMPVAPVEETGTEAAIRLKAEAAAREDDARKAAEAEKQRVADEKAALEAARIKAEAETPVIYTRVELEAIAANDGIKGLREISDPLGVKGRSVTELVNEILAAQAKKLA